MAVSAARLTSHTSLPVQVLMESREQRRHALRYIAAMKESFPEVLQTIKTHQLAQELLLYKEAYLHEIHKTGGAPLLHTICIVSKPNTTRILSKQSLVVDKHQQQGRRCSCKAWSPVNSPVKAGPGQEMKSVAPQDGVKPS